MRTTIQLDDDIHDIAWIYARARDISLGAALSELVRNGKAASSPSERVRIETAPNGLPIIRSGGRKLTPEIVKEAQEDDLE
ncbi:MAG: hypothetical protein P4K93_17330 [Terracidiphilus sp.]|nr:hypothetical protein [Terracidiphilus sp.]MDR3799915.1 hypothetical protein [Terracidiphilus sp.]